MQCGRQVDAIHHRKGITETQPEQYPAFQNALQLLTRRLQRGLAGKDAGKSRNLAIEVAIFQNLGNEPDA